MFRYSDSDFRLFFEEIRSAAAEFSTAFAATQLFLNLSFFPPLRILSHLNFFKQWVMSIFFKFFVVNSYKKGMPVSRHSSFKLKIIDYFISRDLQG